MGWCNACFVKLKKDLGFVKCGPDLMMSSNSSLILWFCCFSSNVGLRVCFCVSMYRQQAQFSRRILLLYGSRRKTNWHITYNTHITKITRFGHIHTYILDTYSIYINTLILACRIWLVFVYSCGFTPQCSGHHGGCYCVQTGPCHEANSRGGWLTAFQVFITLAGAFRSCPGH